MGLYLSCAEDPRGRLSTVDGVSLKVKRGRPADHADFDVAQDGVGFLGCDRTLLTHVQLFIHMYS